MKSQSQRFYASTFDSTVSRIMDLWVGLNSTSGTTFINMRPAPFEVWATVNLGAVKSGTHGVCLWGSKDDAVQGCEDDERVCRVSVEVLEVI